MIWHKAVRVHTERMGRAARTQYRQQILYERSVGKKSATLADAECQEIGAPASIRLGTQPVRFSMEIRHMMG